MKIKHYFFLLFLGIFSISNAQHIIKPNGDVAAKPDLPKVRKLSPETVANAKNLRISGKTSKEIAAMLKKENATAPEVYHSMKPSVSDSENVGALCTAGYTIWEITETLKMDGKTALETTHLLKNSEGCTFTRNLVLRAVKETYRIRLDDMVSIIRAKYTEMPGEIVDVLLTLSPNDSETIDAIGYGGLATNCREVCILLNGKLRYFNRGQLSQVLQTLMRSRMGGSVDRNFNYADGLMVFEPAPIEILVAFKNVYFSSTDARTALELAKIGKHLNISRNDVSTFLRGRSYTATQVLDALQTTYGS